MNSPDLPLIRVDMDACQVWKGGRLVPMRYRCVRLLNVLLSQAGTVVTHEQAMLQAWDRVYDPTSRTLNQHVRILRDALGERPHDPQYIRTVRGLGYVFNPDAVDRSAALEETPDETEALGLVQILRALIGEARELVGQLSHHIEALTQEDK